MDRDWRARFHGNLDQDSKRLSVTAQALVAYLDGFEQDAGLMTPQEEFEAWVAEGRPAAAPASDAARDLAQGWQRQEAADRAALPDAALAGVDGADPARLAAGLSDTPVTLAAKSLLRVGSPVVLAVSTNDGLGASGENMARLCQRKHYYFVPYGQDDPTNKPNSLKADFARLPAALDAALAGRQLQPVLLQNNV